MVDVSSMPALIIALDSKNDRGNYIHILDSEEGRAYYCPCCGEEVRPRCVRENKKFKYQPHYYHVNHECDTESMIHFLYKEWLFKPGNQFYIGNDLYTVKKIEIEKAYNTSFGIYKPDITVTTSNDDIMYFEIAFTNRKDSDYFCKWQELNNDVIEINTKELIMQESEKQIPRFKLIYHDGECFVKEYTRRDLYASTIGERKNVLKRQDRIDYKIQWERLDWFWMSMRDNSKFTIDGFKCMSLDDQIFCYKLSGKMHCQKNLRNKMTNIINDEIINNIRNKLGKKYKVSQISARKIDVFHDECKTYKNGETEYWKSYTYVASGKIFDKGRNYETIDNFIEQIKKDVINESDIKDIDDILNTLKSDDIYCHFNIYNSNVCLKISYILKPYGIKCVCSYDDSRYNHTKITKYNIIDQITKSISEDEIYENRCIDLLFWDNFLDKYSGLKELKHILPEYFTYEFNDNIKSIEFYSYKMCIKKIQYDNENFEFYSLAKIVDELEEIREKQNVFLNMLSKYDEIINKCKNGYWHISKNWYDSLFMRDIDFTLNGKTVTTTIEFDFYDNDTIEEYLRDKMDYVMTLYETKYNMRIWREYDGQKEFIHTIG